MLQVRFVACVQKKYEVDSVLQPPFSYPLHFCFLLKEKRLSFYKKRPPRTQRLLTGKKNQIRKSTTKYNNPRINKA